MTKPPRQSRGAAHRPDPELPPPCAVWRSVNGRAGYHLYVVQPGVFLAAPWGDGTMESVELYGRALVRMIEDSSERDGVLVLDYRNAGRISPEGRRNFLEQIKSLTHPLAGVIFFGVKPILRVLLRLARRMNSYSYPMHVRDDLASALELARLLHDNPQANPDPPTPRPMRWRNYIPPFLLRRQVAELRDHIAEFNWERQDYTKFPVPHDHPYYEIFELWGAVKTDIEMMDRERRRHEAELGEALRLLRDSEHRYRAVFEASGAAMVLFGEDRRIRMANEAALRMSGLRRDQMEAGFEWTALVHPDDLPRLLAYHMARSADSSLPSQYEARFLGAGGKERIASVTVETVPGTNLRVASLNDLTETRRAEAEVMRLARNLEQRVRERTAELEETNRKLGDALRTREEFLATMSHELRTPLASILNLAESLIAGVYGPVNTPQAKAVSTMESNGKHLLDLITDILDLSKSQAGKLELRRATIALSEAVLDAAAMIRPNAEARDLTLIVESDRTQDLLHADPRRVRQMIVNLLSNAVKFTPVGRRLGVKSGPSPLADHLRIEVWDEGIGISEQEQSRLFQPFVQLDNRLAREHSGTGLGLSLTRSLVELHGGTIHLESSVGGGSRFFIDLPRGRIEGLAPSNQISDGDLDGPGEALRLLIIEDNEDLRTVLADYLEAAGHDVLCAESGQKGLEIIQEQDIDTILLDVQMPRMDGYEVLRRIRSRPESAHLPVIAMTGLAFEEDARRCREAGADLHVAKPLRMAELMRAIRSLQNRKPAP